MNALTISSFTAGKLLGISVILVISTHSLGYFYYICIILINHGVVFKYYSKMRLYMSNMLYKCNTTLDIMFHIIIVLHKLKY